MRFKSAIERSKKLSNGGAVHHQRLAQPNVQGDTLAAQDAVHIDDPLTYSQGQVNVISKLSSKVLQRPPSHRAQVKRLYGAQRQRNRAWTDGIAQIVIDRDNLGAHHGLQHVVQTAHGQVKRLFDFSQAQRDIALG